MEYDTSRASELKIDIKEEGKFSIGDSSCEKIEIYKLRYDIELPIVVTIAKGYIDVINGRRPAEVPAEKKWFTYLNTFDGVYGLKLNTKLDPKRLGAGSGDIKQCVKAPDDFKLSIRGTFFDDLNTEETSDSNMDWEWDN